tara:strand:+ start:2242 stop:2562 length:321 start_codon:yes stop_codon:yes gene_type:complete
MTPGDAVRFYEIHKGKKVNGGKGEDYQPLFTKEQSEKAVKAVAPWVVFTLFFVFALWYFTPAAPTSADKRRDRQQQQREWEQDRLRAKVKHLIDTSNSVARRRGLR